MADDRLVLAARIHQGIAQDRQQGKGPLFVNTPGQADDVRRSPAGLEVDGPERVADDVAEDGGLELKVGVAKTVAGRGDVLVDRAGVVMAFAQDARLGGASFGNNGIVWDPRGFLITGHYTNGMLFKVTRGHVEELPAPKLPGADGLTLTPGGLVVVTNSLSAPGKNAVTVLDTRSWQVKSQRDWGTAPTTAARTPYGTYVLSGRLDVLIKGETSDVFSLDRADLGPAHARGQAIEAVDRYGPAAMRRTGIVPPPPVATPSYGGAPGIGL